MIYSGSGVLNFAQAAMATLGAYLYFEMRYIHGWGFWPAFLFGVVVITLIGVLIYHLVMRPLRDASALAKTIASLGILILIQGVIALKWHENPRNVNAIFPTTIHQIGNVLIPGDRIYLVAIAVLATALLWAASKYTPMGLAIRASAENQRAAATLGWSPHVLATISWALGAGLAGAAGILIAPVTGINPEEMPFFILPVLAAALVGGFTSFWITLAASFAIGITQSEFIAYVSDTGYTWGLKQTLPFLIIIVLLVVRGEGLPVRGQVVEKMSALGTGKVRWGWLAGVMAAFVAGAAALVRHLAAGGTDRLVRMGDRDALGGGAARLHGPAVAGAVRARRDCLARCCAPRRRAGLAGRVRRSSSPSPSRSRSGSSSRSRLCERAGINLAVVTLGLAMGVNAMIFTNTKWVGSSGFTAVPPQHLFGINIDPITHIATYGIVAFVALVLCSLSVASIRRGVVGRRLIAVRTNERAAAALGISVFGVKLYAFAFGAAIAAIGGVILTFRTTTVAYSDYTPLASILAVAYTVIGGVGYVLGAPFGSQLVQGGFGTWLLDSFPWWGVLVLGGLFAFLGALLARAFVAATRAAARGNAVRAGIGAVLLLCLGGSWIVLAFKNGPGDGWRSSVFSNPNPSWLTVIGGLTVTLLIVIHPDGAVSVNAELFAKISAALRRLTRRPEQRGARDLRSRTSCASRSSRERSRPRTSPCASAASSPSTTSRSRSTRARSSA